MRPELPFSKEGPTCPKCGGELWKRKFLGEVNQLKVSCGCGHFMTMETLEQSEKRKAAEKADREDPDKLPRHKAEEPPKLDDWNL